MLLATAFGLLAGGPVQAQTYTPIAVSGFNHDIFAEAGSDATLVTDTVLDATSHIMYTQAFASAQGMSAGIADNGLVADAGGTYQFQLAPYTGSNGLTLLRGRTLTLTLDAPAAFARLSLLAFSTENASTITVTVNFVNGSSLQVLHDVALSDWFNATSNVVVSGFGRTTRLAAPPFSTDGLPSNPRFYHVDFSLPCASQLEPIASITISNTTTTGSNAPFPNAVVLALSGSNITQGVAISSTPATCGQPNGSATLTVTGNSGPYTYSWPGTSPVQTGATATGLLPGTYSCTVTNAFGCTSSHLANVAAGGGTATASATANPASICAGASSQLTVSLASGTIASATWTPGVLSGSSVSVSPSGTTPYTVNGTDINGCSFSANVTVTVVPASPPPAPLAQGAAICSGATATLSVQNPNILYTYTWYAAATGGSAIGSGLTYTTPVLTATTTYYLQANLPCVPSARTPVTVTVAPAPAAPTAPAVSTCGGTSATVFVQGPDPSLTYRWYDVASGGTALSTNGSYTTPALSANTTYYVEAVSAGNCVSARTAVPVNVLPAPALPAAPDAVICVNGSATLTVINPQPGVLYEWYTAPNAGSLVFTGSVFHTPPLSVVTVYYLEARIGSCINGRPPVQVSFMTPLPAPVVTVVGSGNSAVFSWNAIAGAVGYEVSTDGGGTWSTPSSGATGTTHTVLGLMPGVAVTLQVRALAPDPCANSTPGSATVMGSTDDVFVPNVFTPNADGRNDVLLVFGSSLLTIDFRVWDQWGNEVFRSTDSKQGWDGTCKGQRAPVGVYVFALRAVLTDGKTISRKGSVNLLR